MTKTKDRKNEDQLDKKNLMFVFECPLETSSTDNKDIPTYLNGNKLNMLLQQGCQDRMTLKLQIDKEQTFFTEIFKSLARYGSDIIHYYWTHFKKMENKDGIHSHLQFEERSNRTHIRNRTHPNKQKQRLKIQTKRMKTLNDRQISRNLIRSARTRAIKQMVNKKNEKQTTKEKIKKFMGDLQRYK